MSSPDFKDESEVKDFLKNLGIEYRFGCYNEKKPEVCHLLGDYFESIKKDFSKAAKVYKTNCDDHGYAKSCHKYGNFTMLGRGRPKEDHVEAYKYFEKGCSLDEPSACLTQGLLLVTSNPSVNLEKNNKKGMQLLEKSCKLKNGSACYYLSGMYISGVKKQGGSKEVEIQGDMEKAFSYGLQGCELGNVYCCANLSQMYAKGEGVKKNDELSQKYKKKALEMQAEILQQQQTLTFQEGLPKV